jgi:phage terminase small subunit
MSSSAEKHMVDSVLMKRASLRPKQVAFVQEYVCDFNASQAAIRAGYSPKTAGAIGHENLNKPQIRRALEEIRHSVAERAAVQAADVLRLANAMAMANVRNYFNQNGEPLAPHELSEEAAAAVQGVDVVPTKFDSDGKPTAWAYRYRLCDKSAAIDKLFRHFGLYEKESGRGTDPVKQLIESIHERGSRLPVRP